MQTLLQSKYLDFRNGGYYIAGSRIGLFIVAQEFQEGRSAESILETYPSIGSLAKVYGTLTFILEHPEQIEEYLRENQLFEEELQAVPPMSSEAFEIIERHSREPVGLRT